MTAYATATELQASWSRGEGSPSAFLAQTFARIEVLDPKLRAFIALDREGAAQAAEVSDARIASGTPRALEGVPVAVKSNIAVAGLPWDAGMELRRDIIAETDAEAVARLRAAGAIILGTLNMHEAAIGATTDNPWFGRALNPHGEGRTPGGSSGGSGAAVAAGLAVAALGTDTLGSVRIPAAYNGVYGLKPTNGAISDDGLAPLSKAFDSIGPLARSLEDLQSVTAVLMDLPPAPPITRMTLLHDLGGINCEPAVLAGYQAAFAALVEMPCSTLKLGDPAKAIRSAGLMASIREMIEHLGDHRQERAEQISPALHFLLDHAEARTPERLRTDAGVLARTRDAMRAALPQGSALLLPATPHAAFTHGSEVPIDQADFTALANIAGLPSLVIPAGRDADGMPVAVQLVGAPGSESALFDLARRIDDRLGAYAPPLSLTE